METKKTMKEDLYTNLNKKISNCLRGSCMYDTIFKRVVSLHKLFCLLLLLFQNGCCMPPETCTIDDGCVNATFWYRRKDEGPLWTVEERLEHVVWHLGVFLIASPFCFSSLTSWSSWPHLKHNILFCICFSTQADVCNEV